MFLGVIHAMEGSTPNQAGQEPGRQSGAAPYKLWPHVFRALVSGPSDLLAYILGEFRLMSGKVRPAASLFSKPGVPAFIFILFLAIAASLITASYLPRFHTQRGLRLIDNGKWLLSIFYIICGAFAWWVGLESPPSRNHKFWGMLYWVFAILFWVLFEPVPQISSNDFARLQKSNQETDPFITPDTKAIARGVELSQTDPLKLAQGKLALGNFEQAIALLDKGLASVRTGEQLLADAHFYKARALWALQHRDDEALSEANRSLAIRPDFAPALVVKCSALRRLNKPEKALHSCERAIQIDPNNVAAWTDKGNVLIDLERFGDAVAALDVAIGLNPSTPHPWSSKADALHHLRRNQDALKVVNEALRIAPNFSDALLNKGTILKSLGRIDEAAEIYQRLVKVNPRDPEAWNNLGDAVEDSDLPKALESYDVALQLKPDYATAWFNKGHVLNKLGRHNESQEPLKKAIRLNPKDYEALYQLAFAFNKTGKRLEALAAIKDALKVNPNYPDALKLRQILSESH